MMRVLALETSTEYCSVAVWQDGEVISQSVLAGQRHSELLLAMIDQVINEAGVKLTQLDGIAFGAGPGSFTGVRIACGVAQGLALGASLPVLGVCTLQALAYDAGHEKIIAALDARMDEIYFAAYRVQNGAWETVCEPTLCLPQNAPVLMGTDWYAAGSGFVAQGATLAARFGKQLAGVNATAIPQASAVAQLAAPMFATGQGMDAALAMPLYLRNKVALKTTERQ